MKGQTSQNKKRRKMNRHHLTPKSRGGDRRSSNMLLIEVKRHDAWHYLWGNRTLDEVILLLQRLKQLKEAERFRYSRY
jgi:hypothetical protein